MGHLNVRYLAVILILLFPVYIYADLFPTKLTLGSETQSLKVFHKRNVHQYKAFFTLYDEVFYPYLSYEQKPVQIAYGSVSNLNTADYLLNGLYSKAGLMAQFELAAFKATLLPLKEALYGSIALRELLYVSYLDEKLNDTDNLKTYSIGSKLTYPSKNPFLEIIAGAHASSTTSENTGNGYYYGVALPFTFQKLKNRFEVININKNLDDPITVESTAHYKTEFHQSLSELRFSNEVSETLIKNKLSYKSGLDAYYIEYQALSTSEIWLFALGADIALTKRISFQTRLQKQSEVNDLEILARFHFLKVFDWEV